MSASVPLPPFSDALPAWFSQCGPQSDVAISTRVRLARNLANHRFPYHAGMSERKEIFDEVSAVFKREKAFRSFSVINCNALPRLDLELLLEERLISPDLLNMEGERGVAVDGSRTSSVMINEEDHLRLHSIDSGLMMDDVWRRLDMLDNLLGRFLPYAYEMRRGFLTSCPTNSGTGLRVSFLLHLPGLVLTKMIDQVLLGASQMGISTRGFFGEHSEVVGNLFQLSNQATLGACESEFMQHTHKIIGEVIAHERTARERILADAGAEIADRVYRAWGILLHAKMLSMAEFLNLASALRLGIDYGIFSEISARQLNCLTLAVMPAHLQRIRGRALEGAQRHAERAELVQAFVKAPEPKKASGRARNTIAPGNNKKR